ncbi:hypothetical protein [Bifidobacterium eulemuris]|nr:hypothetical protein [Bifidobacterium eulemuris]QOL31700.1 hypothetical protein BE0216_03905 [Bifidobacterium eulemuris]
MNGTIEAENILDLSEPPKNTMSYHLNRLGFEPDQRLGWWEMRRGILNRIQAEAHVECSAWTASDIVKIFNLRNGVTAILTLEQLAEIDSIKLA